MVCSSLHIFRTQRILRSPVLTYLAFASAIALAVQATAIAQTAEQAAGSNPIRFDNLFAGFTGFLISTAVALIIYIWSKMPPKCQAYNILKGLTTYLGQPEGQYYFTHSSEDNQRVAEHLYKKARGEIIATAFHENPLIYGQDDLASHISADSDFTRITCAAVCDPQSEESARESLSALLKGSNFVVLPKECVFTRIDGIFSKLRDGSCLAFLTFRHPSNPKENRGAVFMDGIDKTGSTTEGLARTLFIYYRALANQVRES